jgi:hypothetical protein
MKALASIAIEKNSPSFKRMTTALLMQLHSAGVHFATTIHVSNGKHRPSAGARVGRH